MLWTIIVILLILWLLGMVASVGSQFIHLLLIVAGAVLIYNMIRDRRKAF